MKINIILVLITLTALVLAGCQIAQPGQNITGGAITPINIEINETAPITEQTGEAITPAEGVVIQATEGDLVRLKPEAYDPDGDKIIFYFTEPFDKQGRWQTSIGDAGKYVVTVTASDGKSNTTEEVIVIIQKANKPPVIECPEEVVVKEGELINLNCNIYDPEGESVVVEYSGFMKSPTYQTKYGDAGDYTVQITARDKEKESTGTVKIKIIKVNRAPEITGVEDTITATETDVVTLNPKVTDPDGDKVTVTYSEPFDKNGVWKTKIGDAGTYKASIIATDGKSTAKKDITVVIVLKNTPPVLKKINDITVYEGDTIDIPIDATDRDGDLLNVTVKGWMNSPTYTTTYDDAGNYTVTVVVTDGVYTVQQTFNVIVLENNRPPIFSIPA